MQFLCAAGCSTISVYNVLHVTSADHRRRMCRFFARLGRNAISVYEAPEMGLLDKKSVKLDAVQDFSWSPADPIL